MHFDVPNQHSFSSVSTRSLNSTHCRPDTTLAASSKSGLKRTAITLMLLCAGSTGEGRCSCRWTAEENPAEVTKLDGDTHPLISSQCCPHSRTLHHERRYAISIWWGLIKCYYVLVCLLLFFLSTVTQYINLLLCLQAHPATQ